MIRSTTAVVAGLVLALAGCGKAGPTKPADDKSGTPTPGTPTPAPGTNPPTPAPAGPVVLRPQDPAQQAAEKFVAELRSASETPTLPPDLLARASPAFLKVIGKPTRTD